MSLGLVIEDDRWEVSDSEQVYEYSEQLPFAGTKLIEVVVSVRGFYDNLQLIFPFHSADEPFRSEEESEEILKHLY